MQKDNFKNCNILITGGAGFIGSHLVDRLLETECNQIIIVDNLSTGLKENLPLTDNKKVKLLNADISDDQFWKNLDRNIDYIFNLAAIVSVPRSLSYPMETYNVNTLGFVKVLEFARENNIKKVIYASSSAVYGDVAKTPIAETFNTQPNSPYGHSKLSNEDFANYYYKFYAVPSVGLRFFNVYGPRQRSDSPYSGVISIFVDKVKENKPVDIFGDGSQIRDFIYVADVVDGLMLAAKSQSKSDVFNLGSGESSTISELFDKIAEIFNYTRKPNYHKTRKGDIHKSLAKISKIKSTLGFAPKFNLKTGLQSFIAK